ncbi:hypothetical protein J6590_076205 [Homalodisca vitripennis]|nr:hypothetical protein J6590_076205 [Homalodisca vitripennis]
MDMFLLIVLRQVMEQYEDFRWCPLEQEFSSQNISKWDVEMRKGSFSEPHFRLTWGKELG